MMHCNRNMILYQAMIDARVQQNMTQKDLSLKPELRRLI